VVEGTQRAASRRAASKLGEGPALQACRTSCRGHLRPESVEAVVSPLRGATAPGSQCSTPHCNQKRLTGCVAAQLGRRTETRAHRTIVTAGLALVVCIAPLLRPSLANASAKACITTLAGDTCLAQCIGDLQRTCGSDPACHQSIAAAIQFLATTRANTDDCADAVANVRQVCGCVASPSGAFLDTSGALF